jgi:hypothetical protein
MKRRSFLQMLTALVGLPFLPKAAAKPPVHFTGQNSLGPIGPIGPQGPVGAAGPHLGPPVGTIQPYMGNSAPLGWLPCDGRVVSARDYPALHAAIGKPGKIPFALPVMQANFEMDASNQLLGMSQLEQRHTRLYQAPQYIIKT